MNGWDVLSGRAAIPAGMLPELAALRRALPAYDVIITSHSLAYRYEAIRRIDGPGPWCVISTDAEDLRRELAPATSAGTGRPPHAPPSVRSPATDSAKTRHP